MTTHHFSVDVDEYFQVSASEGSVPRTSWADVLIEQGYRYDSKFFPFKPIAETVQAMSRTEVEVG